VNRDGPGLAQTATGQPGLVVMTLGQTAGIPCALAVPDEPEDPIGAGVAGDGGVTA